MYDSPCPNILGPALDANMYFSEKTNEFVNDSYKCHRNAVYVVVGL